MINPQKTIYAALLMAGLTPFSALAITASDNADAYYTGNNPPNSSTGNASSLLKGYPI